MREAIVVIGMHRSGTSMVAGILKRLGLDIGKSKMQPDYANITGYFENSLIAIFNDRLLDLLYSKWHDTLFLPENWWLEKKIKQEHGCLIELIREEYNDSSLLLFKDPRISILLPFYQDVFKTIGIKPNFIINFREPYEVAASLNKRNNLSLARGLLLWIDYILKAELYSRNQSRIFIHYNQILNDPIRYIKEILHQFNLEHILLPEYESNILEFVAKDQKHHSSQKLNNTYKIPDEINRLYNVLVSINGRDTDASIVNKIDQINARFYSKFRFYQGLDGQYEALLHIVTPIHIHRTLKMVIHPGENKLEFEIDFPEQVSRIILNPSNQRTAIKIERFLITTKDDELFELHPERMNADWISKGGMVIFETEVPEIFFLLDSPRILKKINLDIVCVLNTNTTNRLGIEERNVALNDLRSLEREHVQQLSNQQREIEELLKLNVQRNAENEYTVALLHEEINNLTVQKSAEAKSFSETIEGLNQKILQIDKAYKAEILNQTSLLEQKQNEIFGILHSYTWKTGKFILSPAQFFLKKLHSGKKN